MRTSSRTAASRILKLLACLVIGKVLVSTLLNYRNYVPPNFDADFLLGRERYFWHGYHGAFYVHIVSGPVTLILGTILVSDRFRRRFPGWHRLLGRIQAVTVLFIVAPSGLAMAWYAANGPVAGLGFALLACSTGLTVALGWRAAVMRRFDVHRRWMWRCYLLLCSTVILRLNVGLFAVFGIDAEWLYIQMAWSSWLVPLLIYEALLRAGRVRRIATAPTAS